MDLTLSQMIIAALAAMMVGFSKTGITGSGIIVVPVLAGLVGPKQSVGLLLPMLILADVFGVAYHRKNADWHLLCKLLPWVMPGILIGYVALGRIDNASMGVVLAMLVLFVIALRIAQTRGGTWLVEHVPHTWWFAAVMGIAAGFATMVGNCAGPIMAVFLLSRGFDKHRLMGTAVWYFLIINLIKVPFSAHRGLITADSLLFDLKAAPFVVLGALVGMAAFRRVSQVWFSRVILILAALAALRLLVL